jgi:2-oxoglutarate dehydrogenase E2 component (dihydrolipoamide succinyltransferase)
MTTEVDVDLEPAASARERLNEQRTRAGAARVSVLPFIARAAVSVLADFPDLNATFEHDRNVRWREVNLGVAVDSPAGLVVPVIRRAADLSVSGLADAIADLAAKARARKLMPDDVRAGTFTISNPGSFGAVSAPAIINQPQVAILGMPSIVRRPWVKLLEDGSEVIAIRPIMRMALTFDHRAVDGADATRYLVAVRNRLEAYGSPDL